jgi:hypothetical protein
MKNKVLYKMSKEEEFNLNPVGFEICKNKIQIGILSKEKGNPMGWPFM